MRHERDNNMELYSPADSSQSTNDLNEVARLLKQMAVAQMEANKRDDVISSQIDAVSTQMDVVFKRVNSLSNKMSVVEDKIHQLEYNEEITDRQKTAIQEAMRKRVAEITRFDETEMARYYRGFSVVMIYDLKRTGGMGSKIATTKKGDFQRVINNIEAWMPKIGCMELKHEIDRKARKRKIARMNGYE